MSKDTTGIPETRGRKNAPYIQDLMIAILNGESSYTVNKRNINSARVCINRNKAVRRVLDNTNKWMTSRIINGQLKIYIRDKKTLKL